MSPAERKAAVTDDFTDIHLFYLEKLKIHLEMDADVGSIYLWGLIEGLWFLKNLKSGDSEGRTNTSPKISIFVSDSTFCAFP